MELFLAKYLRHYDFGRFRKKPRDGPVTKKTLEAPAWGTPWKPTKTIPRRHRQRWIEPLRPVSRLFKWGQIFHFLGKNGVRIQSLLYTKKQTASLFLEVWIRVIFFHVSKNMQERLRRSLRGGFNPIERYRISGHFRIAESAGFLVSLTKPPLSAQLKA